MYVLLPSLSYASASNHFVQDFGEMLAHPQEVGIPGDDRYVSFAMAGRQTEAILKKALFEKHIKSIESLGKRTVFGKIWKDVDACFQKAAQKHIEQVVVLLLATLDDEVNQ